MAVGLPLFLISASILLQEIYWLRTFAEIESGHLASMVVSAAMLGIGAGSCGVLLAGDRALRRASILWPALLALSGLSAFAAPLAVKSLPFEAMLLAWQPTAWLWLLLRELIIALPLAFGAAAVTLIFRQRVRPAPRLYAVHLLGSAAGVVLCLPLIAVGPASWILGLGVMAALWAGVVAADLSPTKSAALTAIAGGMAGICLSTGVLPYALHKGVIAASALPEARTLEHRWGPRGSWWMLTAPSLHSLPGLSLTAPPAPGGQWALFVGGDDAGSALPAGQTDALARSVSWLPYALRPARSALILDCSSPQTIQQALLADVALVTAVVPDGRTRAALSGQLGVFAGLLEPERVRLVPGPSRGVLARVDRGAVARRGGMGGPQQSAPRPGQLDRGRRYDLVVLPPHDSLASATGGLGSSLESFTLTVEGLGAALDALGEDGILAIQRWTQAPPRDLPKLVASLDRAMRARGIDRSGAHMALARHWDLWSLCASPTPFGGAELARLAGFALDGGYDILLPAMLRGDPRHEMPGAPAGPLLDAILEASVTGSGPGDEPPDSAPGSMPSAGSIAQPPFDLRPATDARPYFHHFLRWSRLSAYWQGVREGTIPPGDWGDLFLAASLLAALALGGLFILAPPLAVASSRRALWRAGRAGVVFLSLGLGYMQIEVLFLHQSVRVLGEPGLAAVVLVGAFLLGSGLGSAWLDGRPDRADLGRRAALGVAGLAIVLTLVSSSLLAHLEAAGPVLRWCSVSLVALIVAIPMGMPFPAALEAAGARRPDSIPWLMALNAWGSVVGAPLASAAAIGMGFPGLALGGAGLYLVAAIASRPNPSVRQQPIE